MHEISCPHCGKAFKIDEAGYADILKQMRDGDFERQLYERLELAEQDKRNARKTRSSIASDRSRSLSMNRLILGRMTAQTPISSHPKPALSSSHASARSASKHQSTEEWLQVLRKSDRIIERIYVRLSERLVLGAAAAIKVMKKLRRKCTNECWLD